jgi:uncharacterized protein
MRAIRYLLDCLRLSAAQKCCVGSLSVDRQGAASNCCAIDDLQPSSRQTASSGTISFGRTTDVTPEWKDAVHRGCVSRLQQLLTSGADIDARDEHGQTALMIAAAGGHSEIVEWLVERGAALDHTAKYGLSALMLAVVRGRSDVVRKLTDAGANPDLRGTGAPGFAGKTALDLAIARGEAAMVESLRGSRKRQCR